MALPLAGACSPSLPPGDDDTAGGTPKGGSSNAGRSSGGAPVGGMAGRVGGAGLGGGAGTMTASAGAGAGGAPAGAGGMAPNGGAGIGGALAGTAGQGGSAAGAAPLGGAAGLGGFAGGGVAGAPLGGSGGSGGQATGFFMDDFEADTTGMQPAGWDNFISYQKNNPQNPAGAILALTDTMHHGGTKSVHFHGDGNPAQLARALPMGMTKLYVRAWVFMTRKLGQQTDSSANHESLIVLRRTSGNANDEVRFGEIKGVIGTNEVPSDNISPTMDKWHLATGPVIPASTWSCLEVSFLADAMPNTLHATADSMLIQDITSIGTDQWQNGAMPSTWLAAKFAGDSGAAPEIVIGWQSFSSAANDVWMDDLVLSTSPIGCN